MKTYFAAVATLAVAQAYTFVQKAVKADVQDSDECRATGYILSSYDMDTCIKYGQK